MTVFSHRFTRLWSFATSIACILLGLLIGIGGFILLRSGGTAYYLIGGVCLLLIGALLLRHHRLAVLLVSLCLFSTSAWAVYEVGMDWWQLLPRLDLWIALGLAVFVIARQQPKHTQYQLSIWSLSLSLAVSVTVLVTSLAASPTQINGTVSRQPTELVKQQHALPNTSPGDWVNYGGTAFAQHYSPLTDITPSNVHQLQVAWHFHTGDLPGTDDPLEITNQVTPLKIENTLFLCTPHSIVIALNATTGQQVWRYDPHIRSATGSFKQWAHMTCRGVSYYDAKAYAAAFPLAQGPRKALASDCPRRLFLPTADARLIALNADNGQVCQGFGKQGTINLLTENLDGRNLPGGYYPTSPPAITHDLVVTGSHVSDNDSTFEASGVVRAFDVNDGHLVWNWDSGNPELTNPLPPGQRYSHNSANVWSVISVDEALGLLYLPMGNQTPDQWGGDRSAGAEKYSVGIVALDTQTGRVRWNYQFVHHDLWDHDVSAQPTLIDLQTPQGVRPALIASSKQGSIYILDRRNGTPLFPIHERPVAQGALPGDHTAPTQPVSAINFEPPRLTEAAMWGVSPIDQLYCRIRFRQMRYDGQYTPPSLQETLVYPGNAGVFDWGGVAVDPVHQILVTNPNAFAFTYQMVPATEAAKAERGASEGQGIQKNTGAPYAVKIASFLTPWGFPCQAPPWGWIAAVDLLTGKIVWQHKNGTTRDVAPLGIPLPLGLMGQGGPLITAGGVAFLGATVDNYLRGYAVSNGQELFRARLPAGGQATPMSYQGNDGRQYIVIMAGGHGSLGTKLGDSLIAYALPKGASPSEDNSAPTH